MIKYINDKSPFPQSIDEIDDFVIDFEGHDKPQYIHQNNKEAGYLGLDNWAINYWDKPALKSTATTGSLVADKFYSIKVVPVKTNVSAGGLPIYGTSTMPSIPKQCTGGVNALTFDVPIHSQLIIKEIGRAAETTEDRITDTTISWEIDEQKGRILKNVETGIEGVIWTSSEYRAYANGVDFTTGDRYQILESATQKKAIYAAEFSVASDLNAAAYYKQATIDSSAQTYELDSFTEVTLEILLDDSRYLPPPNANCCRAVSGVAFCGGGITEDQGRAQYVDTPEIWEGGGDPFSASTPVVTGTGNGTCSVPTEESGSITEDWTLTNETTPEITITGDSSPSMNGTWTLSSNVYNSRPYWYDSGEWNYIWWDGTDTWYISSAKGSTSNGWKLIDPSPIGDYIGFGSKTGTATTAYSDPFIFGVVGSVSGAQADLTSGTPYTCDYFSATVTGGDTPWHVDDEIGFEIVMDEASAIAVSFITDDYTDSDTSRIMRLTASGIAPFANARVGSYVTITDSEDSENDVTDCRVLHVQETELTSSFPAASEDHYAADFRPGTGAYYGTRCSTPSPSWDNTADSTAGTPDWETTLTGYFTKDSEIQYIWGQQNGETSNWSNQTQITAANEWYGSLTYAEGSNPIGDYSFTVAASEWDEGYHTFKFGMDAGVFYFKQDGEALTYSGTLLGETTNMVLSSAYTMQLGRYATGPISFSGWMEAYSFTDSRFPNNTHSVLFNESSGTTVIDSISGFVFTFREYSYPDPLWIITPLNPNTGNGEATDFSMDENAWPEGWVLTCTALEEELVLTGTPTPDTDGIYSLNGTYNGQNKYTCTSPALNIWWDNVDTWYISATAGTPPSPDGWKRVNASPVGTWTAIGSATGTPTSTKTLAKFSVIGSSSGEIVELSSNIPYSCDSFDITITDGSTAWAVDDTLSFNISDEYTATQKWIEIENNNGVINTDDEAMHVSLVPNYIDGNTSGGYKTHFSEGLVDARITFDKDSIAPMTISWVDTANQEIGLSELYTGTNNADWEFEINSNYPLYYSDNRNPHKWPGSSIIDIHDNITGIGTVGGYVIVFCKNSVWRVNPEKVGAAPILLSSNVRCPSQFSIVETSNYIMFYDGTGFSITDGVKVKSVTNYTARDYLNNINREYEHKIQGAYNINEARFEYYMPFADEENNNYGIFITADSWNCYPVSRPDVNALWCKYKDGVPYMYHGTSGDYTGNTGLMWQHEGDTDSYTGDGGYVLTITDVDNEAKTVTITCDEEPVIVAGDQVTIYPSATGGSYKEMIVKTIAKTSTDPAPYEFEITVDSSYDLSDFGEDDLVCHGLIPFDYGVKWTDFGSPQYLHQVRAIHLDIKDMHGILFADQYLEMSEQPVQLNAYSVIPEDTKVIIPFTKGKGYKYGFRIRGMSLTRMKIHSIEIMFDTQV